MMNSERRCAVCAALVLGQRICSSSFRTCAQTFPIKDIGVLRAIETLYGIHQDVDDIERTAELWRPYRTVAAWYLWRYIDSEPVLY